MPTFEPAQLSQWLHTCETKHSLCSEAGSRSDAPVLSLRFDESATSNFRLVDLERACIVEASLDSRYVVLSYVGVEGKLKLTSANYEQLSAEGVLADPNIHTALPAVIRDAFGLVQAIGERYLWVDALCLLHDDKDDINVGVSLQYAVFRHSLFTIVAAAGDAGPSLYDSIINSDNTVDAALALSSSVHARRAWTLGEVALSQRAVLLAQKCVFFCCRQGTCVWLDNCLVPVSGKSPINCIPSPVDSIRPCLTSYVQLSQEYSRRVLSRDGDALRAFHGIGRPLFAGMRTVSVEGLPAYYVNAFLLFKTTSAETSRRREFASYSWAGWCGGMEWLLTGSDGDTGPSTATDIVRWLQNNSLVEWDDLTTTGQVHRLRQWRLAGYDGSLSPPSNLAKFLEEHAHLFGGKIAGLSAARIDDTVISPEDDLIYGSGSHARLDKVDWWKDVLCEDKPIAPARFPRWAFDLVASRGQLERLQRQLDSGGGVNEKAARSWTASRWASKLILSGKIRTEPVLTKRGAKTESKTRRQHEQACFRQRHTQLPTTETG